jgi:TRAP-type C4-dicarboxylate transport system substrate-binding protein
VPGIKNTLEHWGASTASIAVAEIYNSLKQKVVDGQENGMETVYGYKFYEIQKYYCGIDYIRSGLGWWINADKWNSLTQEQQAILLQAGKKTAAWANGHLQAKTQMWFEACRANGMTMVLPPFKPWVESVQPVIKALDGKAWEAGLYKKINDL